MIIKSNFKDYYDFVAFQYGGGDPKITYCRSARIQQEIDYSVIDNTDERIINLISQEEKIIKYYGQVCNVKCLIFCGKSYPVVSFASKKVNASGNEETVFENYKIIKEDDPVLDILYSSHNIFGKKFDKMFGKKQCYNNYGKKCCLQFSIMNKLPVFLIKSDGRYKLSVDEYVPNLGELGFGGILSPEQCYQELSYFIGNVMSDSPDLKLPCEINNEERIIAAGFDLKNSFRKVK